MLGSPCDAVAELDGTLVSPLPLPSLHRIQGLSLSNFSASAGVKLAPLLNIQALKHRHPVLKGEGSASWDCGNSTGGRVSPPPDSGHVGLKVTPIACPRARRAVDIHHQEEGWNRIAPETSHPAALGARARVPWPRLLPALASLCRAGQGGGVFRASHVGAVQRKRHT